MTFADILVAIVALCVVIIIHEFGHYIIAVRAGMKVDRFSVFGIGPPIVKLAKWRGTDFVIGAIPFGAYVLIRGMEPADPNEQGSPPSPDSPNFRDKPLWRRALVIAGGPIANYVAAIAIYLGLFLFVGQRGPVEAIEIDTVVEGSAAEAAGLEVGDRLTHVGDVAVVPASRGSDVSKLVSESADAKVEFTLVRDGEVITTSVRVPEEGAIGIGMLSVAPRIKRGFIAGSWAAFKEPFRVTGTQATGLYLLVTNQIKASVSGPVGIVQQIARSAQKGLADFIEMTAIISTLLGFFNLLPIPALDGGRLTFLGYEAIARRKANPRVEEMVHGYGMLALLALILLVTVGDVRRVFF